MSKLIVGSLSWALVWGVGQIAAAQEQRPQRDAGLFERIDTNKDGVVTADEVSEDRKGFFERLVRTNDKNKDGKLTREEFTAAGADEQPRRPAEAQPGRPGEGPPNIDPERAFRFMDKNGDGKLTPEEVPEERRDMFKANISRADKDGDGSLNLEEFKGSMEAMARMMGRGPQPGGPAGGPPNLANSPFFRALDANGDGKISADELAKASEALKSLDRNKDGSLTPEELAPPGGPGGLAGRPNAAPANPPQDANARAMLERLKQADANGDGKLSKEEAPDRLKENFDRIDANGDGFIDAQEGARIFGRRPGQPGDGNPQPRRRPQQPETEKKDT